MQEITFKWPIFYFILTNFPCFSSFFFHHRIVSKYFSGRKSMIYFALASLVATLSDAAIPPGTIFTAKSKQEVCDRLGEVLNLATQMAERVGEILIFVDVDETTIRGSSDFDSFEQTGTFEQMKVVNEPLVEKLHNLHSPSIRILALTSAGAWYVADGIGKAPMISVAYASPPSGEAVTRSKVRSDAMQSLGIPLDSSLGSFELPPVTLEVQLSEKVIPDLRNVELSPELEGMELFSDLSIFCHVYRPSFGGVRRDLYFQNPHDGGKYKRVIALPLCENGVIFSNPFDFDEGWKKGLIVESFLRTIDRSQWPTTIIAIDDNRYMLESIRASCVQLGITFYGICFIPTTSFWIL
jgi:hypothetical protein